MVPTRHTCLVSLVVVLIAFANHVDAYMKVRNLEKYERGDDAALGALGTKIGSHAGPILWVYSSANYKAIKYPKVWAKVAAEIASAPTDAHQELMLDEDVEVDFDGHGSMMPIPKQSLYGFPDKPIQSDGLSCYVSHGPVQHAYYLTTLIQKNFEYLMFAFVETLNSPQGNVDKTLKLERYSRGLWGWFNRTLPESYTVIDTPETTIKCFQTRPDQGPRVKQRNHHKDMCSQNWVPMGYDYNSGKEAFSVALAYVDIHHMSLRAEISPSSQAATSPGASVYCTTGQHTQNVAEWVTCGRTLHAFPPCLKMIEQDVAELIATMSVTKWHVASEAWFHKDNDIVDSALLRGAISALTPGASFKHQVKKFHIKVLASKYDQGLHHDGDDRFETAVFNPAVQDDMVADAKRFRADQLRDYDQKLQVYTASHPPPVFNQPKPTSRVKFSQALLSEWDAAKLEAEAEGREPPEAPWKVSSADQAQWNAARKAHRVKLERYEEQVKKHLGVKPRQRLPRFLNAKLKWKAS